MLEIFFYVYWTLKPWLLCGIFLCVFSLCCLSSSLLYRRIWYFLNCFRFYLCDCCTISKRILSTNCVLFCFPFKGSSVHNCFFFSTYISYEIISDVKKLTFLNRKTLSRFRKYMLFLGKIVCWSSFMSLFFIYSF